jgi:hypothetical protein
MLKAQGLLSRFDKIELNALNLEKQGKELDQ